MKMSQNLLFLIKGEIPGEEEMKLESQSNFEKLTTFRIEDEIEQIKNEIEGKF